MTDITEEMQMRVEHTVTYNNFPGMVAKYRITESGFEYLDSNKRFTDYFGQKLNYRLSEMTAAAGMAEAGAAFGDMRQGLPVEFQIAPRLGGSDAPVSYFHVKGEQVDRDRDPIYLLIFDDRTEVEMKKRELEYLAYTDPLTGGINRTRFGMRLKELQEAGTMRAAVWLNIRKFKLINDLAGSAAGDALLKYVYDCVAKRLRPCEYVCRTTADNYALLLEDAPDETISARLNEIANAVNSFNTELKRKYIIPFTAGICRTEGNLSDTTILDRAHAAQKGIPDSEMTKACACRFFSERELAAQMAEKDIENRMRDALENGEFEVYLQPKFSLKQNKVVGAEALVRWNDPQRGIVSPAAFIPIFEKNGFVVVLDLYVFSKVCAMLRKWSRQGIALPVSVNMSRLHFSDERFLEPYVACCKEYGIDPALIEIELTETLVFESPEVFKRFIDAIHDSGFRCSMDDFGSGYSSLNILKHLDVDVLKLDRAFFSSPHMADERENTVVKSIIGLAKALSIDTVAEGVETEKQEDFLKAAGCDVIQGFIFSKPVPQTEFEKLITGNP